MVEMKSGRVVLSLAAQLASWRAVLVLVRTWATCKPWQCKDFHQYSIFLVNRLNQSKQTVWESAGGATATESRKVGKGRRKRRYADVDGHGAKPEPELGPRGPTLKKQSKQTVWESAGGVTATESRKAGKGRRKRRYVDVDGHGAKPEPELGPGGPTLLKKQLKQNVWESTGAAAAATESRKVGKGRRKRRCADVDGLGAKSEPELGPTLTKPVLKGLDWLDLRLGLQWERATAARDKDSSSEEFSCGDDLDVELSLSLTDFEPRSRAEAMDPAGSPSSIRKVADTARPSSSSPSAAPVPGWRSIFCLGNGK